MLEYARQTLPPQISVRLGFKIQFQRGPFDLVVSVLAVHHLDGPGKADLFRRVANVLVPGGRFVVGDVVVPDDPADAVTPIDDEYDTPSSTTQQLGWLHDAGFRARIAWVEGDLAVLVGDLSRS